MGAPVAGTIRSCYHQLRSRFLVYPGRLPCGRFHFRNPSRLTRAVGAPRSRKQVMSFTPGRLLRAMLRRFAPR